MIWSFFQIRRQSWIAKAKSVGICTVVKASLGDQRLTIPNFTILGHSPTHHTSFELIDEDILNFLEPCSPNLNSDQSLFFPKPTDDKIIMGY